MRLIDADALDTKKLPKTDFKGYMVFVGDVNSMIRRAPTIETEPVVHAGWKEVEHGMFFECSNCGHLTDFRLSKFCPDCGARMDKKEIAIEA